MVKNTKKLLCLGQRMQDMGQKLVLLFDNFNFIFIKVLILINALWQRTLKKNVQALYII